MSSENNEYVLDVKLSDVGNVPAKIQYQDEELVLIDNLRDIPDPSACKIAFNVGLICLKGKIQFKLGGTTVKLTSGHLMVCHSHVLLSNFMASPDIECRAICLSDRALKGILQAQYLVWNKAMYPNHYYILKIDSVHLSLFETLLPSFNEKKGVLSHEILICLIRAGFLLMCDLFSTNEPFDTNEGVSRMNALFHQFLNNVAKRQKKKAQVADYANELCISPKYLTTICRKMSGKSAMAWISDYVTEDIIYYLKNTDLSAKEIAWHLGFENASFFCKFVKARLGMSPQEYRKSIMGGSDS